MSRDRLRRRLAGPTLLLPLLILVASGCGGDVADTEPGFDVMEKSVRELGAALESGEVTSVDLVEGYLARITAFDQQGPSLNAMIALNPNAREEAAALDAERVDGTVRGPLHGIPVVVKDNYDTADMPTTAGTLGLATSVPPDDSTQVRRLREAGAIILGKTNMHELARGITTVASYGGQTRNPYDPERNPGGSSGGTGSAVAASFGAFGMGSDTCGSIRIPSAHHHLVGLRGTRGLASGDGIIPLSTTQDIGGPLARSVEDLALALDATVGPDPADPTTSLGEGQIPDTYTAALNANALAGARIGVVDALLGEGNAERPVRDVIERAVGEMEAQGATSVEITEPDLSELTQGASVIGQEFRFDLNAYLQATPGAYVRTVADFVETGLYHDILEVGLQNTLEVETRETDEYREAIAKRDTVRDTVMALLDEQDLDALVYPTIRRTARPIGQPQQGSNCSLSATSGLPAITVPAGAAADGMPVGLELLGRPWSESRLIELAYAYEQGGPHRRPPDFTPSLVEPPAPIALDVMVQADGGLSVQSRFVLESATRTLDYRVSTFGLFDDDVLSVALHRRGPAEDAVNGPVVRQLARRGGARTAGRLRLSSPEMHALRNGRLYLAVHTVANPGGAVRIDLSLP
ncbi:MAG: CHRD domain-containing protein [Acidobacteria bacterium]|nr:CHRD domain-containing protein [Acidobacteriota bacterium]